MLGRLEQVLARSRRHGYVVAVLVLDLDRFGSVNNRMGYEWGDAVLEQVAKRLHQLARTEDTVARMDGDQFVVLLEQVDDMKSPARVAHRIIESFRDPLHVSGDDVVVSLSIGVAVDSGGRATPHELLRDASLAMRRAKKNGKGRFEVFDPLLGEQAIDRLVLESRMRDAITERELVVEFQPEVLLSTRQIIGMEALVRWQHPTQGRLLPGEFIPVAEETGLIVPIGRWVLQESCRVAARFQQQGLIGNDFRLNVNVSVRQLQNDEDFLEEVARVLASSGLSPDHLAIEITETSEEIEPLVPALEQLRMMGVGVALDDFGTGYSSLARLGSLPVSIVKIDQRFVRGITDPANLAIVRAVNDLGSTLRMLVVAEGIETPQQLDMVRSAGCMRGQGFLFSRAVPEETLREFLRPELIVASRLPKNGEQAAGGLVSR